MKYTLIISGIFLLLACTQAGNAAPVVEPVAAAFSSHDTSIGQARTPRLELPILLAESWFSKFYRGLVSSLGSRKAMFQFAMCGMLVALFIIWWRK